MEPAKSIIIFTDTPKEISASDFCRYAPLDCIHSSQSRESFLRGLALYEARPDKGYSLTDCISIEAMRQKGLTEVLANDRHFEQEGFRALFRS